jgi:transcriptional regulator
VYIPEHFRETRIEVMRALVERYSLGTLVAVSAQGIDANHIPMQWLTGSDGGLGLLRGHIARANPMWRQLPAGAPVLAIFIGPDQYVSPTWYPSKREHGRAVPTWNYATVHIQGQIRFIEEAAWLREQIESLTDDHERARVHRWRIGDAPEDYISGMVRAIVGFEIPVSGIECKFKSSQNRTAADRAGVAAALHAAGVPAEEVEQLAPAAQQP